MTISYGRLLAMGLLVGLGIYIAQTVSQQPALWSLALAAALVGGLLFLALIRWGWIGVQARTFGCLMHVRCQRHPSVYGFIGYEADFLQAFDKYRSEDEVIYLVALRHPSGRVYAAKQPARHHHVIALMSEYGDAEGGDTRDQGFVTSWGRYVGREEACVIATRAQQILVKTHPQHELFSEDVWAGPLLSERQLREKTCELVKEVASCNRHLTVELRPRADRPSELEMVWEVKPTPDLQRYLDCQQQTV